MLRKTFPHKSSSLRSFIGAFRRDDDGGLIIFSLFMIVLILFCGGMAVDFMRYETVRAKLQATNDRAVLAAADLDQTLPPADVVRDYFAKAGMSDYLDGAPVVDEGLNYRIVTANASAQMPLFFHDLLSVFTAPFEAELTSVRVASTSTAEERVSDIEVSLVLDVSSSMLSDQRIENLKPAAQEFVTTVLDNNTDAPHGLITISMIPYSAVVNAGPVVAPFLTGLNRTHDYSTCPLFDPNKQAGIFTTTALNLAADYDHVAHFEYAGGDVAPIAIDDPINNPDGNPWCYTGGTNAIVPVTSSESTLHTAIDNLAPYGNTAIDMGMKWAVGLLDPSTRPMIAVLAATDPNTPIAAAGRPYNFEPQEGDPNFDPNDEEPDVVKVIVLMTDGANTNQFDLQEPFKTGTSNIWFHREYFGQALENVPYARTSVLYDGDQTAFDFTDDKFYWNGLEEFHDYPQGFVDNGHYTRIMELDPLPTDVAPNVANASWQALFAIQHYQSINDYWLEEAHEERDSDGDRVLKWWRGSFDLANYASTDYAMNTVSDRDSANTRLQQICTAARAEGIIIYTVAFEAPTDGQAELRKCADSSGRYFNVEGTDISKAFASIAADIRALKLTK